MATKQLYVLSLEDCDNDYLLLQKYFRKMEESGNLEIHAHRTTTVAETLTALDNSEVDFIFADLCVPDSLGLSTATRLAHHGNGTPIVIISGTDRGKVDQQKLIDLGVIDFLDKAEVFKNAKAMEHNVCRLLMAWATSNFRKEVKL